MNKYFSCRTENRLRQATVLVKKCMKGGFGVEASTERYEDTFWTRDAMLAVAPLLLTDKSHRYVIWSHLDQLIQQQRKDGKIPIVFVPQDLEKRWLSKKIKNSLQKTANTTHRAGKPMIDMSFMLERWATPDGIADLTPNTKDSEILFLYGCLLVLRNYQGGLFLFALNSNTYNAMHMAADYIRENVLGTHGLCIGGDWRDTLISLGDKAVLTNNCWFLEILRLYEELATQKKLPIQLQDLFWTTFDTQRRRMNRYFWNEAAGYYNDYVGSENFDTLGNALAILMDVVRDETATHRIIKAAMKLSTPYGFVLNSTSIPPRNAEEEAIMAKLPQTGVVWPFVHLFFVMALMKAGMRRLAAQELEKFTNLEGFFEYYDPTDGSGHGSSDQLWSAALYLRAAEYVYGIPMGIPE